METTKHYKLPLLAQNQSGKEFTINHAFNRVDHLMNRAANSFEEELPEDASTDDIYIIKNAKPSFAEHENKIIIHLDGAWQFLSLSPSSIFYVRKLKSFFLFDGKVWTKV